jgi:hypothetical protein
MTVGSAWSRHSAPLSCSGSHGVYDESMTRPILAAAVLFGLCLSASLLAQAPAAAATYRVTIERHRQLTLRHRYDGSGDIRTIGSDFYAYDLVKNKDGNIKVKPKNGKGPGEPTGLNINDFVR